MRQPNNAELNAFKRLSKTTDGNLLVEFLEESLLHQDKENRTTEHTRIQLGQGKSQAIQKVISLLE